MLLRRLVVPYFDHPLCGAGEEYGGDIGVPRYVVDGGVVGRVGLQEPGAVLGRALVDQPLVRPHQEHGVIVGVEGHAASSVCEQTFHT